MKEKLKYTIDFKKLIINLDNNVKTIKQLSIENETNINLIYINDVFK